jgi:hypothetical protein
MTTKTGPGRRHCASVFRENGRALIFTPGGGAGALAAEVSKFGFDRWVRSSPNYLRANNFAGVPESTRVKLPAGKTWEALANMIPEQHLGKIEQARR